MCESDFDLIHYFKPVTNKSTVVFLLDRNVFIYYYVGGCQLPLHMCVGIMSDNLPSCLDVK